MRAYPSTELVLARHLVSRKAHRHEQLLRIRELAATSDARVLLGLLIRWRLLGAAIAGLDDAQLEFPQIRAAAAERLKEGEARGAIQVLMSRQLQGLLKQQGIPSVVMKGPSMALRLYGAYGTRVTSSDIDLLVARSDAIPAREAMSSLGWGLSGIDPVNEEGLPIMHFEFSRGPSGTGLDLHWRPHWFGGPRFAEEVLAAARTSDGLIVPSQTDELLVLLTSFARDGFVGLRLAADVAAWWDSTDEDGDAAQQLLARVAPYPDLRSATLAASAVVAHVVGTPRLTPGTQSRRSLRTAAIIAELSYPPLPPAIAPIKRTIVDAVVAPETLADRWLPVWLPRRARILKPASWLGRFVNQRLIGRTDR